MLQTAYEACPLCNGPFNSLGKADCTSHALFHDDLPKTIQWCQCQNCSHVFTDRYWTSAGLEVVFRNAHDNQQIDIRRLDAKRAIWLPVVERAVNLLGGYGDALLQDTPSAWLDVGCGDGSLVMTASDIGFNAMGLDARQDSVQKLKQFGIQVYQGNFTSVNVNGQVQVLSMMDVLEHMAYPRQALQKAQSVLTKGGLLIVSLPDLGSSVWRLLNQANANPYWGEIEHHHNFSRERLFTLLHQEGFKVIDATIPNRYKAQIEVYASKV